MPEPCPWHSAAPPAWPACPAMQVWTVERSTQLGLAVSSMLKGYTTTAAKYTAVFLKSVAKFSVQVRGGAGNVLLA